MAESGYEVRPAIAQPCPSVHTEASMDGWEVSDEDELSGAREASRLGDVLDDIEHWTTWLERQLSESGGTLMQEHRFDVVIHTRHERQKIIDCATSRIDNESSLAFMWRLCSLLLWQNYLGDEERLQVHLDMSFLADEEAARICEWAKFLVSHPRQDTVDMLRQRIAAGLNRARAAVPAGSWTERTRPATWVSHEGPAAGPYWLLGEVPYTETCAGLTNLSRPNRNFKTQAKQVTTWGKHAYWHVREGNVLSWGLGSEFGGKVQLPNASTLFNSGFDDRFEEWVLFPCIQLLQDDLIARSDQRSTNSLTRSHHILKFLLSCAQQVELRTKWLRDGWAATLASRDMQKQIFQHVRSVKGTVKTQLNHLQSIIHKDRSLYAMVKADMAQNDAPYTTLSKFVKAFWTLAPSLKFLHAAKQLRAAKKKQKLGSQPKEVASGALWVACVLAVQKFVRDVWHNAARWVDKLKTLTLNRDYKGFHEITKKVMLCATTGCFGVCRTNQLLAAQFFVAGSTEGELPRGETRGFVYAAHCGEIVFRYTAESTADKLRFLSGPRHGLRWPPKINHVLRWYLEEVKPREYALFDEGRDALSKFVVFLCPVAKKRTKQRGKVEGNTLEPYANCTRALQHMMSTIPDSEKLIQKIVKTRARPNLRAAAATYFASEADRTGAQNAFDRSSRQYWLTRLQGSMTMGHSLRIELETYDFSSGNNGRKIELSRLLETGTAKWLEETWCNMPMKEWRRLLQANMTVRYLSIDGVAPVDVFELPVSVRAGTKRLRRPLRWEAWNLCHPTSDSEAGGDECDAEGTSHVNWAPAGRMPASGDDGVEKIAAAPSTNLLRASDAGSKGFGGSSGARRGKPLRQPTGDLDWSNADSDLDDCSSVGGEECDAEGTVDVECTPAGRVPGRDDDSEAKIAAAPSTDLLRASDAGSEVPGSDDDSEAKIAAAPSADLLRASDAGSEGFGGSKGVRTRGARGGKRLRSTTADADCRARVSDLEFDFDDGSAARQSTQTQAAPTGQTKTRRRKAQHWKFHLIIPVSVWTRAWQKSSDTGRGHAGDCKKMLALAKGAVAFSGSVVKTFVCENKGVVMATITFRTGANLVLHLDEAARFRVQDSIMPNAQAVVLTNELGGRTSRSKPRPGERFMGAITQERIRRVRDSSHRAAKKFIQHIEKMCVYE